MINYGTFRITNKIVKTTKTNEKCLKLFVENNYKKEIALKFNPTNFELKKLRKNDYITIIGEKVQLDVKEIIKCKKILLVNKTKPDISSLLKFTYVFRDKDIKRLFNAFLSDDKFMKNFLIYPASINNHQSYKGGLFEHTVTSMEILLSFSSFLNNVNMDIALMGVFLHDLGKLFSIDISDNHYKISEAGKNFGHPFLGTQFFLKKAQSINFNKNLMFILSNIILTHHNSYFVDVRRNTIESKLVAYIDNINAMMSKKIAI